MADIGRLVIPVDAGQVLVVGTGGEARERAEWRDGTRTGEVVTRDGAAVRRLTGVAVSVAGTGLDGAAVETTTPLDGVPAGVVFRAAGQVEIAVRADARAGFQGGAPRGVLAATIFVERLEPVGSVAELLAGAGSKRPAAASARDGGAS